MKLFHNVEWMPKYSFELLFDGFGAHPIFKVVMHRKEVCLPWLPLALESLVEAMSLPPILHMQMDNAASDNKNRYVFHLWSMLVAHRVFHEVHLNFMLVEHTHDDIDA